MKEALIKPFKLGDIGPVCMCKRILKEETSSTGEIPFYKIGTFGKTADAYISRAKYQDYKARFSFPRKGDILLSAAGTIGRLVVYDGEDAYYQDSNIVWVKNDETQICNQFLYYALKRVKWPVSQGSTILRLYNDDVRNVVVYAPASLLTQTKIAKLLSSLDDKIALNRKKIEKLEALAKTIYDYWFVQFDFPDANGRPYKSSGGKMVYNPILKREIPEGWEVGNILKVSDLKVGGTPSKKNPSYWNGEIPFWGPTDYTDGVFQFQTSEKISDVGFENCSSDMLSEDTIIITARGSIGKVAMVGVSMAMNQSCFAFEAHENSSGFVYFLAKQLVAHLKATSTGSVFNAFVASDLNNVSLSLGKSPLRKAYADISGPLFKSIKNAAMEIRKFTSLRDFLLPLLMNGQVEVGA